jgi:hypothetical protein
MLAQRDLPNDETGSRRAVRQRAQRFRDLPPATAQPRTRRPSGPTLRSQPVPPHTPHSRDRAAPVLQLPSRSACAHRATPRTAARQRFVDLSFRGPLTWGGPRVEQVPRAPIKGPPERALSGCPGEFESTTLRLTVEPTLMPTALFQRSRASSRRPGVLRLFGAGREFGRNSSVALFRVRTHFEPDPLFASLSASLPIAARSSSPAPAPNPAPRCEA